MDTSHTQTHTQTYSQPNYLKENVKVITFHEEFQGSQKSYYLYDLLQSNRCKECDQKNTGYQWCNSCNAKHFQQNFKNWTSDNDDIDKFIQDIQLSVNGYHKLLEWIPYNRLHDIEYIAKGGFGTVYKAKWSDGYIHSWNNKNKNWKRLGSNMFVALKSLNNSKNITLDFINEITLHHKITYYELNSEIREAEKINNNNISTGNTLLTDLSYETHPEATYTSRLLNFNNLPEPVNYDEQDDKIMSVKFSDCLQIDILNLKINDGGS
ncbi:hypothetical protein C1646_740300 [Rhizophagus diaphanus]|nr:hypothetical protein C1646_740300 [Rhizophagus diaphanus] [Rhizophagus sp. MUCL 43196]